MRKNIFVSYSHKDATFLERMQTHLKPSQRTGKIDFWDDTRIKAGDDWKKEIEEALKSAEVAILLVSPDFLASEFIAKYELPFLLEAAKKKGLKILQIYISHVDINDSELRKIQAINSPNSPLKGLEEVEQDRVWKELSQTIKYDNELTTGSASIAAPKNYIPIVIGTLTLIFALLFIEYLNANGVFNGNVATLWLARCLIIIAWLIGTLIWVKHMAQRTNSWLVEKLSKYRRKYIQHLYYRHRYMDVKGLSTQSVHYLELDQVFVDLRMDNVPVHQARTGVTSLLEGKHQIWKYLNSNTNKRPLAILGPPGSGKTTLLKSMAIAYNAKRRDRRKKGIPDYFPVMLFLRDHTEEITKADTISLPDVIANSLRRYEMDNAPPESWWANLLSKGQCLVMLDGLDEVADAEKRKAVVSWVDRQITKYAANQFVVSSRPHGYESNPLQGVTILEVAGFDNNQISTFVNNWYLANEVMSAGKDDPGIRQQAKSGARDLLARLAGASNLAELAVNPLLLTMIATVHRYRSSLPGRRVELYEEIFEVFLGKRAQSKGLELDLTPFQKKDVLQPLAFEMMKRKVREIAHADALAIIKAPLSLVSTSVTPEDFLKEVENDSGLLQERENDIYSFSHLTFQEYLASVFVKEQEAEELLIEHVETSWWHEVIRLYSARADASSIIRACLDKADNSIEALTLAIDCEEEALRLDGNVRDELQQLLSEGAESEDIQRRKIIAEAHLSRRLKRLIRLDDNRLIDSSLVTHSEYQLFLNEKYAKHHYHQPDHWIEYSFPAGSATSPVLGINANDAEAFCDWLTSRDSSQWNYRLPTKEEAEQIDTKEQIRAGYWIARVNQIMVFIQKHRLEVYSTEVCSN